MVDVDDGDDTTLGASSTKGTNLGSNDDEDLLIAVENAIDDAYFDNPFDD